MSMEREICPICHGAGFLTKEHYYRTNLLAYWRRGEKEPWLLATNFPTQREALRAYRKVWRNDAAKPGSFRELR